MKKRSRSIESKRPDAEPDSGSAEVFIARTTFPGLTVECNLSALRLYTVRQLRHVANGETEIPSIERYFRANLPARLDALWEDFLAEAYVASRVARRTGEVPLSKEGREILREIVVKNEAKTTRARLGGGKRGGSRRVPAPAAIDEMDEMRLATFVNEVHPLWTKILRHFKETNYDAGSVASVKTMTWFKSPVPGELLRKVLDRKRGVYGRPLAFALLHARIALGITRWKAYPTLYKHYVRGKRLISK